MPMRAFKLIEVALAIGMIFLMVSVAIPALRGARGDANQTLCLDNLLSQGQAATFYSVENDGWFTSGIQSTAFTATYEEWGTTYTLHLPYFGETADPLELWNDPLAVQTALAAVSAYQCPSHPDPNAFLDYVVNAAPLPFTFASVLQSRNEGMWPPGESAQGVVLGAVPLEILRRLTPRNPLTARRLIYMTESHPSITTSLFGERSYRFHQVFLAAQLPFARTPRIASDQRHPDGLNTLFMDGSAVALQLGQIDPGPREGESPSAFDSIRYRFRKFSISDQGPGPADPPEGEREAAAQP